MEELEPPEVRVMLLVLRLTKRPVTGLVEFVKVTVFAKPLRLPRPTMAVPPDPTLT